MTGTVDFHIFAVVKFNTASPTGEKFIAGNYGGANGAGLEYNAYTGVQNLYKGGYTSGTNAVVDGTWHLFEARRVGTTISLWFDNKLDGSATVPLSSVGGSINWTIGNGGYYPAGNIGYMAEHTAISRLPISTSWYAVSPTTTACPSSRSQRQPRSLSSASL